VFTIVTIESDALNRDTSKGMNVYAILDFIAELERTYGSATKTPSMMMPVTDGDIAGKL